VAAPSTYKPALLLALIDQVLIVILLLAGSEFWRHWRMRRLPLSREYFRVRPCQRLAVGVLYFGLAAALLLGMHATHVLHGC